LDWINKTKSKRELDEETPVILVAHGMTGGSNKKYMKAIAK
jgi:predicted alpha/beta-fold hydrolase